MRTLVTGGFGFVGSNLVRRLLERGDEVRVIDNLATGRRTSLADADGSFDFREVDLRSAADVDAAMEGIDVVFHLGALPAVPRSVEDPVTTDAVNVGGTLNVLVAARAHSVARVVFASSSSVYGDSGPPPRAESNRPAPSSPYAASKLAAEHYCAAFARTYGLATVSLRYFNVYGPGDDPALRHGMVVPRFVDAIAAGRPVQIHGDGEQTRDFTYVADVVDANLLAAGAGAPSGCAINVANGRSTTVNQLAERIGAVLGRPVVREHLPTRAGDVNESWADVSEARRLLGFTPRVPLDSGLALAAAPLLEPPERARRTA